MITLTKKLFFVCTRNHQYSSFTVNTNTFTKKKKKNEKTNGKRNKKFKKKKKENTKYETRNS